MVKIPDWPQRFGTGPVKLFSVTFSDLRFWYMPAMLGSVPL